MARLNGYQNDDPSGKVIKSDDINTNFQDELEARVDLRYIDGHSDKVYITLLIRRYDMQSNIIKYIVAGLYGRYSHALQVTEKEFSSSSAALSEYGRRKIDKVSKGYQLINEEDNFSKQSPNNAQYSESKMQQYLKYKPADHHVSEMDFLINLAEEDYVLEELNDFDSFVFMLLTDKRSFLVYDENGALYDQTSRIMQLNTEKCKEYRGTIIQGYARTDGSYAMLDILHIKGVDNVISRPWTERRSMLTTLYHEIHNNVTDPFDRSARFHLNEYYYANKDEAYKRLNLLHKMPLRHINSAPSGRWLVKS